MYPSGVMKLINQIERTKDELPKGKISVRWVQSRGGYQVYIGGKIIPVCSGDTPEDSLDLLDWYFDTPNGYRSNVSFQ